MNIYLTLLQKNTTSTFQWQHFQRLLGFLQEDILQYNDNIDDLTEKFLLLENVDFELSRSPGTTNLFITMKAHASTSQEKWTANCLVKKPNCYSLLNRHFWKFIKSVQFMILEWFYLTRETLSDN